VKIGALADGRLARIDDGQAHVLDYQGDLRRLLADGGDPAQLATVDRIDLADARLAAPVRPGKIIAASLNYLDHCREANLEPPVRPPVFAKLPSSVIGPGDEIVVDRQITEQVDWEVELGVVIGSRMSRVPRAEALTGVFGYTVANDVSARDLQVADGGQVTRAKSLDTFAPVGPWIVTADEIPDPQALRLWATVNGTEMQAASAEEMIFGVAQLLEYCSLHFTLEPGDLLMTGTPAGIGILREPPVTLQHGDSVTVGVERIGELTNRVVDRG
jgi:2-keto-4-pentenoate hydratase/2-oxohepta-3-ene-1,7-dioic acid hydratase in catechol pathway